MDSENNKVEATNRKTKTRATRYKMYDDIRKVAGRNWVTKAQGKQKWRNVEEAYVHIWTADAV